MTRISENRLDIACTVFLLLAAVALFLPVAATDAGAIGWLDRPALLPPAAISIVAGVWCLWRRPRGLAAGMVMAAATVAGAYAPLVNLSAQTALGLETGAAIGTSASGIWLYVIGLGFLCWRALPCTVAMLGLLLDQRMLGAVSSCSRVSHARTFSCCWLPSKMDVLLRSISSLATGPWTTSMTPLAVVELPDASVAVKGTLFTPSGYGSLGWGSISGSGSTASTEVALLKNS